MSNAVTLGIDGLSDLTEIGRGGFATVYSAYQPSLNRRVAVKVLAATSEKGRRRFNREIRSMGTVDDHPNVVKPLTAGFIEPQGQPFLVMEHMAGGSLQQVIDDRGPLPVGEAIELVLPIADALAHSHRMGVLHRDVKPANILLSATGLVKLSDFGIAAIRETTMTDVVSYSLAYAPPETFDHDATEDPRDERSDFYSLAATLFALVSGAAPFVGLAGNSPASQMLKIVEQPAPALGHQELDAFLATALAKRPADRHPTADDFIESLRRVATQRSEPIEPAAVAAHVAGDDADVDVDTVASGPLARRRRWRNSPARLRVAGIILLVGVLLAGASALGLQAGDGSAPSDTTLAAPQSATGSTESQADVPALPPVGDATPAEEGPEGGTGGEQGPAASSTDAVVTYGGHPVPVTGLAVLPDGRAASIDIDGTVQVWDPDDPQTPPVSYQAEASILGPLAVLPDGRLVVGGPDETVHVWDPEDPDASPVVFSGHERAIRVVEILADGRVASGSYTSLSDFSGRVFVWDPADPEVEPVVYRGLASEPTAIAQLPDGRIATASGDDQTVHVWDPDDVDAEAVIFNGHRSTVISLLALPDGRVASGGLDRTVHIWDPDSPAASDVVYEGHLSGTDGVYSLALLPDGRIASASPSNPSAADSSAVGGTVQVWDPDAVDAAPIPFSAPSSSLEVLTASVVALGDGRLASAVGSRQIDVWNPDRIEPEAGSPGG